MFIHNINPVAFEIASIQIRYYGLVYFLGFIFMYFFFRYHIKKGKIKHFKLTDLDTFMIYIMLGGIIGGRILDFVFFNPKILLNNPAQILRIWEGGMSIHGGIIGAIISTLIYVKNKKVEFYDLADKIIAPLMIVLGIGRIANFINAELWGTPLKSTICINYEQNQYIYNPPKGCRHPYQLYESAKNFAVGIILIIIQLTTKLKKGILFWTGILMYNVFRFLVDFYRDDPTTLGLNTGQYLCIAFSIISIIFLIKIMNEKEKSKNEHKKH